MRHTPAASRPFSCLRAARSYAAVVLYLVAFTLVLVIVCDRYFLPAMRAAQVADPEQKKQLVAHAWLVLSVVLFVLFAGLLLTFRIGRFFFPRALPPRQATQYTDAWAESGRRLDANESDLE